MTYEYMFVSDQSAQHEHLIIRLNTKKVWNKGGVRKLIEIIE